MKKRILPALLALVMVLGMLPLTVFADDVTVENGVATVSSAAELTAALAKEDATTIKLSADITGVTTAFEVQRSVTIDFDGKKVSGEIGSAGYIFKVGKADGQDYTEMTVNFKDAKIENTGNSNSRCLLVMPNVTMNINGDRTEVKGSGNVIVNVGKLTITAGSYTCTDETDNSRNVILTGSGDYQSQSAQAETTIKGTAVLTNNYGIGVSALYGSTVNVQENASITAHGNALGGNNTAGPQKINVSGGTLTSTNDAAIYQAATGTLTISNGNITGVAGVAVRAGTVSVTGGTITATGTGTVKVGDKAAAIPVAGIVYDVDTKYSANDTGASNSKITVSEDAVVNSTGTDTPAVTVNGGNDSDANKLEVSGGAFSAPVDPKYLNDDLKYQAQDKDGKYTYHETVAEAKEAAAKGSGSGKAEVSGIASDNNTWENLKETLDAAYTVGGLIGGKITLSGLTAGHTYICQISRTLTKVTVTVGGNKVSVDAHDGSNTVAVMFTATGPTQEILTLQSSTNQYYVSVWSTTETNPASLDDFAISTLNLTPKAAS